MLHRSFDEAGNISACSRHMAFCQQGTSVSPTSELKSFTEWFGSNILSLETILGHSF